MINVFVTAYDDFNDFPLLEKIYDKLFSKTNKNELFFYCTVGSPGDNTCMRYILKNKLKYNDWLSPRKGKIIKIEREKILVECDYAIIFIDGYHKGMFTAMKQSIRYVKKLVVVNISKKEIIKFDSETETEKKYSYCDETLQ